MSKIYLDLILRALMVLIELQINKGPDDLEADMDAAVKLTEIQDDLERARNAYDKRVSPTSQ